jgi:gliding motility-associated-like protein
MGDDITITITPSGGNGNYTYTSYGLPVPNPYTAFPEESQTYEIVVGDDCGSPVQVLQVPVDVLPLPPISFYSDVVSGCDPLTVHFVESTPNYGQTYLWNFGDGGVNGTSLEKNPVHEFDYAGTFDVDLVVTSVWGCENHLIMEDFITVYPIPEASFVANPTVATIVKPVIAFSNLSTNNFLNIWSFGDNDSSQTVSPYHTYPAVPGVYNVFLTVTSEFGCKDMVGGTVEIVDQYTFYAPTAFSPDNDFINDLFYVSGNGIEAGNFKLMIYDRWGILVFETDDMLKPWDGKIQGGDLAPVGTYTWYVKYKDPTGIGHQFSGPVTIVR